MEQEYAPVKHGTLSALGTTAAEAGKSGFGGWWKGALIGFALPIVVLGGGAALLGASAVGITLAALGGLGISAFVTTGLGAGIGTLFGVAKGTSRGIDKVNGERGASEMLSAQVEAYKAQAQAGGYQVTPEEYAALQARMRGGDGQPRTGHADQVMAAKQTAAAAAAEAGVRS